MTDNDWENWPGSAGVPTDDVAAYLGALNDGGSQIDETAVNAALFSNIPQPAVGVVPYFGGAYRRLAAAATDDGANTRLYNREGALLNLASGLPRIVSTSPLDAGVLGNPAATGYQVRLAAKISSLWSVQWLNINGTTFSSDVDGGASAVDASSAYRWELALNGAPTTFWGDVGCFIGSQLCCVVRGKLNPRRGVTGQGNRLCSAETRIAIAIAKNTTVDGANRLAAPVTGIGAFAEGVFLAGNGIWTGSDQSLVLPSGPYTANDSFAYVVEFSAIAGIAAPLGNMRADVGLLCNPAAP